MRASPGDREPEGPRRSARRIFGREYRTRHPRGQQYIFVGLAILFLIGWLMFRQSCSKRLGQTFGTVADPAATQDAGVDTMKSRPRPTRLMKADPDDW